VERLATLDEKERVIVHHQGNPELHCTAATKSEIRYEKRTDLGKIIGESPEILTETPGLLKMWYLSTNLSSLDSNSGRKRLNRAHAKL